jgi:hypothetical protein
MEATLFQNLYLGDGAKGFDMKKLAFFLSATL